MEADRIPVKLFSEIGRLKAVLLHKPGPEIEAMTPQNAHNALYSDILNKNIVDEEYRLFAGALAQCTKTYQVVDILSEILKNQNVAEELVRKSCHNDGCDYLADELLTHPSDTLARELIEGFRFRKGKDLAKFEDERYVLKPLYNLFFTRDALSCVHDRALINTMSFAVRSRESLIYKAIFENFFQAETICAQNANPDARTEGGDVQIVRDNLLCVGNGIRTNKLGIEYLMRAHADIPGFTIIAQELPFEPDSFIHLDMVFTFLGPHSCMAYEPLIRKTGIFSNMHTYQMTAKADGGFTVKEHANILEALRQQKIDLEPVFCGGSDDWTQQREQWHSGANFFAFGENHVIGYRRNSHTIDALDHAGFHILKAEDVADQHVDPFSYEKCVVTFAGSELPRGGGGARCMTCPIHREDTEY